MESHSERADTLEHEADKLEQESDQVEEDIEEARSRLEDVKADAPGDEAVPADNEEEESEGAG